MADLRIIPVIARQRLNFVHPRRDILIDVVETREHVAAAAGQPPIKRRRDAEDAEIAGALRKVVSRREVGEPAPRVADFGRDARHQLLLY